MPSITNTSVKWTPSLILLYAITNTLLSLNGHYSEFPLYSLLTKKSTLHYHTCPMVNSVCLTHQLTLGHTTRDAVSLHVSRQLQGQRTYFLPSGGAAMGCERDRQHKVNVTDLPTSRISRDKFEEGAPSIRCRKSLSCKPASQVGFGKWSPMHKLNSWFNDIINSLPTMY